MLEVFEGAKWKDKSSAERAATQKSKVSVEGETLLEESAQRIPLDWRLLLPAPFFKQHPIHQQSAVQS